MTDRSMEKSSVALARLLGDIDHSVVKLGAVGENKLPDIVTITSDSRQAGPGSLFVAVAGSERDGHAFIGDAMLRGCAAVLVEKGRFDPATMAVPTAVAVIEVDDSKGAYAELAEAFFDYPAASLRLVAVTGTNGKTTITYLLEEILAGNGFSVGVIGTVNYRYPMGNGVKVLPASHTTPGAMQLQGLLREMVDNGVTHVVMEVSSHALAQSRLGNLHFDVAAFTNLTRDHLDYHRDMYEYFDTKTLLFTHHLKSGGGAVIAYPCGAAEEGSWSGMLSLICRDRGIRTLACGEHPGADIRLVDCRADLGGNMMTVVTTAGERSFRSPLVGRYNADNVMTALSVSLFLQLPLDVTCALLERATGAPGRLQRVTVDGAGAALRPVVLVDYAHTPDALDKVLATLSALPHRQLFCVFGCGGDRDPGKRPEMGGIAARLSDVVVVTDDNPRSERPETIRGQVAAGVVAAGMACRTVEWLKTRNMSEQGCVVIGGREQAIAMAITSAGPDDIVLLAGKGHEQYQLIGGTKRFFDDCLEAREVLSGWTLAAVAEATGGRILEEAEDRLLGNVATDSRRLAPGEIFVALEGERFDGHDFAGQVVAKGAGCLVVSRRIDERTARAVPQVIVADTLRALGDLANYRRKMMRRLSLPVVIGLTGSCGKTTVKEMTAAILARHWPPGPDNPESCVLKTSGNFNNLIGMPVSLLPIAARHRAAVLEMGMNRPGEIARLAEIAEPDISCITNIHAAHLEGLQSLDGVARAKEELFAGTSPEGVLIVNADDPLVRRCAAAYRQRQVTFGLQGETGGSRPDFWATDIDAGPEGLITFIMHIPGAVIDIHLYAAGVHNVVNALAAAAVAWTAGASPAEIAAGLSDFRAATRRMEMLKAPAGFAVLNDTYNANPASMAAALHTLAQMRAEVSVAVLGDMLELGESSAEAHREIGQLVAELGIKYLALVGEYAGIVAEAARAAAMPPERTEVFADKVQAAEWVENLARQGVLGEGGWVLVKASRSLKMETVVERLTGKA